jgi:hypothetical protein
MNLAMMAPVIGLQLMVSGFMSSMIKIRLHERRLNASSLPNPVQFSPA